MFFQESQQFFLKSPFPVMLLLVLDLPSCRFQLRLTYAECGVAGLPGKVAMVRPSFLYLTRGIRLCLFHDVGNRKRGGLSKQHVNVVQRTIDEQRLTSQLVDRPAQLRKQFSPDFRVQERMALFGAEKRVNQDVCIRVSHRGPRKPRRGGILWPTASQPWVYRRHSRFVSPVGAASAPWAGRNPDVATTWLARYSGLRGPTAGSPWATGCRPLRGL
jgi:hypothetical protein